MAHEINEIAETLLEKPIQCLDKGFVRLVDYMGGDSRIVQSARVSYGAGTKTVREDQGLINYLMRNHHTSPFEQVQLTFHCKMPIFVARQWVRHRTARLNEVSGRYSVMSDECYLPKPEHIRKQSTTNKQGRSDETLSKTDEEEVLRLMQEEQQMLYKNYERYIELGVAKEVARINLPLSLYTEWYWQIDLHNLFHFLKLRLDGHAQYEIRVYGEAMAECAKAVAPMAYSAFEEFILNKEDVMKLKQLKIKLGYFINADGDIIWYFGNKIHRDDDLPAVICANGDKHYYKHGLRHREDGKPAVEYADGVKAYFRNGELYRDDGLPVIEGFPVFEYPGKEEKENNK